MKPNLFIIGAPKTGSTSLYHYLAEHPQANMCADKEPHFFSHDLKSQCLQLHRENIKFNYHTEREYLSLFKNGNDYLVNGDASTSYIYSTTAAEEIYNFNSEAKIIVILREPVELLHSWYHYIRYTSEEPANTFEEALSLETKRKQSINNIPNSVWYPQRIYYRDLIKFDVQLQRYFDRFNRDNIKVMLTEDLLSDPHGTYAEILDFLSLDHHFPDFSKHNIYQQIRFKKVKWLIDNYLSGLKNTINNHSGNIATRCVSSLYQKTMSKDEKRPIIDLELQQQLKDEFRPMVKRTEELVKIKLTEKWDY